MRTHFQPILQVRLWVDHLGAPRIAHGIRAAEDDALVAHLASRNICPGLSLPVRSSGFLGSSAHYEFWSQE